MSIQSSLSLNFTERSSLRKSNWFSTFSSDFTLFTARTNCPIFKTEPGSFFYHFNWVQLSYNGTRMTVICFLINQPATNLREKQQCTLFLAFGFLMLLSHKNRQLTVTFINVNMMLQLSPIRLYGFLTWKIGIITARGNFINIR